MYLFSHARGTWAFSKLQGRQYDFPKHFRCNLTFNGTENFSDSSLHDLFESENVRFPFSVKHSLTVGSEIWKIKLQKTVGNLLDKLRKSVVNAWNGHLEFLSRSQAIENSKQYLLFSTDIVQKTVVGCPWENSCATDSSGK